MTIVRLKGGLGNQMFQYATGYAAAKLAGQELFLDLSSYESQAAKDTHRQFELSQFDISYTKPTNYKESDISKLMRRIRNKIFPRNPYAYHPNDLKSRILDGFFQNERYFLSIREFILKEFSLREPGKKLTETLEFIRSTPSVSMHIRRGDYVSNPHANAYHGVLTLEYFNKAYTHVVSRIGSDFTLFIFTDDVEWTRRNIKFHPRTFILSNQGFDAAEEITLMSACSHNIISNSSFSWWGAWLNTNPDKIVVGPEHWTATRDLTNIMPPTWIRI